MRQLGLAVYRWITPHGLARIVTPRGTTRIELLRRRDGTVVGECYSDLPLGQVDGGIAHRT